MCDLTTTTTSNPDGTTTYSSKPSLTMPSDIQDGWRWCQRCQGLFRDSTSSHGICAKPPSSGPGGMLAMVIGPHDGKASGQYSLYHQRAQGCTQTGWRLCKDCKGLFYGESGSTGRCPAHATSGHVADSARYEIYTCERVKTQAGWRWCSKCQGMFYAANATSVCPAGGAHDGSGSGTYFITHG